MLIIGKKSAEFCNLFRQAFHGIDLFCEDVKTSRKVDKVE